MEDNLSEQIKEIKNNQVSGEKGNKGCFFVIVFLLLIGYGIYVWFFKSESDNKIKQEVAGESVEFAKEKENVSLEKVVNYTVSEGDIPANIFWEYGKFDANDTEALLAAGKDVYNLSNLKIGKRLRFYFDGDERAKRMEYDRDTERVIMVRREGDNFSVQEEGINYQISQNIVRGKIENFFYVDALRLGISEATVLEIGDIFSFDIDFTTEIRQGDDFVIVYEKRKRDGSDGPDGKILAAKFINEGKAYYAYYFDNAGQGGYYDGDGRVLEKQFLKAPLSYRRITSGFTGARMHPITRKVSAHYQIDYAAPTGTPVVSTARGTIISAGWEGGWGNIVRIRHDNGYTTHYGHLSKFATGIKSGVRVSQNQLIGYVGSTGWSTGPHLDYGMKLDGAPVNPLSLNLPKGAPLSGDKIKEFEEIKKNFEKSL